MQLPIDVGAVLKESTDLDAAKGKSLLVTLYYDPSAPDELITWVHEAFLTQQPNASVREFVLDEHPPVVWAEDTMACVVAGSSDNIGMLVASLNEAGVPALVATLDASDVKERARETGFPLAEADVASPDQSKAPIKVKVHIELGDTVRQTAGEALPSELDSAAEEVQARIEETHASLLMRMGQWIVSACHPDRLAFALAFPFVRKPLAQDAVLSTSLQNGTIGLMFFLSGANLPVMTLNQVKMFLMIAAAYGENLGFAQAKELAAIVAGGLACRTVARQLVGFIPAFGWIVKAGIGYGGTLAMGCAVIDYYEKQGIFGKLTDVVDEIRSSVASEKDETAEGSIKDIPKQAVGVVKDLAAKAAHTPFGTAVVRMAGQKTVDMASTVADMAGSVGTAASGVGSVASYISGAADRVTTTVKRGLS